MKTTELWYIEKMKKEANISDKTKDEADISDSDDQDYYREEL